MPSGAADAALWISISELARRKGVSPQAISDRINRLKGKVELRPGRGREKLVNVAQFDLVTGENTYAPQTQAAATVRELALPAPAVAPGGQTLSEAQRQKLMYDTGLLALRYAQERGAVIPLEGEHGLLAALREVAETFVQAIGRLHERAAEAVATSEKDGVAGMRALYRRQERELCDAVAAGLKALAAKGDAAGAVTVDLPTPEEHDEVAL
jgi:hypothetical protein